MSTMKAITIHAYGDTSQIRYEDMPIPQPAEGELLIKVAAAAINPVDWKICEGLRADRLQHKLPLVLGWDLSGSVCDTGGGDCGAYEIGDEVIAKKDILRSGSYCEYIAVAHHELAYKPKSLSHTQAAALPLASLTAWQSIFDVGGLSEGKSILIHAGAGGVGSAAIQLASWAGAKTIATASAANHDYLKSIGCDIAIDYTREKFEQHCPPVDVVLDTIGGETRQRSWQLLKPGGTLVSIVAPVDAAAECDRRDVNGEFHFVASNSQQLQKIAELAEAGLLKMNIEETFTLQQVPQAIERVKQGHTRGKLVVKIA